MKYTKYFANLIKSHGSPQLSSEDFRSFMNIVHLETKVQLYQQLNSGHRYTGNIYKINKLLEELTGKLEPKELIQKWLNSESVHQLKQREEETPWDENEKYLTQKPKDEYKNRSRRY